MNILRKARHIHVCGRSGQGKTSYAERYIAGSHHGKVWIFDWQNEFAPRLGLGFESDISAVMDSRERIVCYDPHILFPGEMAEAFRQFCNAVFYAAGNQSLDSLMVVDELQRIIPVQDPPAELRTVLQTGRRQGLDTLILSQQPNRLHNEIREQFTEIVYFRMDDKRSLEFVEDRGADENLVANLPPLNYLWQDTQTRETRQGTIRF